MPDFVALAADDPASRASEHFCDIHIEIERQAEKDTERPTPSDTTRRRLTPQGTIDSE